MDNYFCRKAQKTFVLLGFLFLLNTAVFAQKTDFYFHEKNTTDSIFLFRNPKKLTKTQLHQKIIENGFLACNVDSVRYKKKSAHVFGHLGKQFFFGTVRINISDSVGFRIKPIVLTGTPANIFFVRALLSENANQLYNLGYPFAEGLATAALNDSQIVDYSIKFEPGLKYKYEKLVQKPDEYIRTKILQNYLNLKPQSTYNQSEINKIKQRIALLSAVEQSTPHFVDYSTDGRVNVYLYLNKARENNIEAMLGAAHSQQKWQFQGSVNLRLHNLLKSAERFQLQWQQFENQSQNLQTSAQVPFILATNWGTNAGFRFLKQDSSYIRSRFDFSLNYRFASMSQFRFLFQQESSEPLQQQQTLAAYQKQKVGFGVTFNYYQAKALSRKGWFFEANFLTNNQLVTDSELNIQTEIRAAFPFKQQFHWYVKQSNSLQFKPTQWLQNELILFGGANSLRGYTENSLSAQHLSVNSAELALLVSSQFRIATFADFAVVQLNHSWNNFQSVGVELALFSAKGKLSFSVANPVRINYIFGPRIHVSYVSLF